ncbi:hypothetical protein ACMAZF_17620 [Psychrobium sp. nBUS_13]|uniref:hypothetical protein n=1 Tax=Psychrobium sp. nBUS_13 TaxID=3395319 RepID=UPI003EBFC320
MRSKYIPLTILAIILCAVLIRLLLNKTSNSQVKVIVDTPQSSEQASKKVPNNKVDSIIKQQCELNKEHINSINLLDIDLKVLVKEPIFKLTNTKKIRQSNNLSLIIFKLGLYYPIIKNNRISLPQKPFILPKELENKLITASTTNNLTLISDILRIEVIPPETKVLNNTLLFLIYSFNKNLDVDQLSQLLASGLYPRFDDLILATKENWSKEMLDLLVNYYSGSLNKPIYISDKEYNLPTLTIKDLNANLFMYWYNYNLRYNPASNIESLTEMDFLAIAAERFPEKTDDIIKIFRILAKEGIYPKKFNKIHYLIASLNIETYHEFSEYILNLINKSHFAYNSLLKIAHEKQFNSKKLSSILKKRMEILEEIKACAPLNLIEPNKKLSANSTSSDLQLSDETKVLMYELQIAAEKGNWETYVQLHYEIFTNVSEEVFNDIIIINLIIQNAPFIHIKSQLDKSNLFIKKEHLLMSALNGNIEQFESLIPYSLHLTDLRSSSFEKKNIKPEIRALLRKRDREIE